MKATILDANAICRYLMKDVNDQYDYVSKIVKNRTCTVTIEILAEVVYVLEGVYAVSRADIAESLRSLCLDINVKDSDVLLRALDIYDKPPKLDFIDCILYGYHTVRGNDVFTFDKKLISRLKSVEIM